MCEDRKKQLLFSLGMTFLWGMACHGYMFLHSSFSHDALKEFNADVYGNELRLQVGRPFVPLYRALTRSALTLPWLIGLLALLWTGLAVYLCVRMFDIRDKLRICLTAGIFTANVSVIATAASYLHDLDCDMFALLLCTAAAYLWKKGKRGCLWGSVLIGLSLGFYQSYVCVFITLLMISLIYRLSGGELFGPALKAGVRGILMVLGGGIFYFVSVKVSGVLTGVSLKNSSYNAPTRLFSISPAEYLSRALAGAARASDRLFHTISVYPEAVTTVLAVLLVTLAILLVFRRLILREGFLKEKLLAFLLTALLPFGMDIIYVAMGTSHDLMHFAIWLMYFFALLAVRPGDLSAVRAALRQPAQGRERTAETALPARGKAGRRLPLQSLLRLLPALLVAIILWGNVQLGNTLYLKKDLEQQANLSLFTRVLERVEETDGYVTGETPVVFVGRPLALLKTPRGFELFKKFSGAYNSFVPVRQNRQRFAAYFEYVLLNPILLADEDIWDSLQEDARTAAMPSYPENGCIAWIDGTLVVKLGD